MSKARIKFDKDDNSIYIQLSKKKIQVTESYHKNLNIDYDIDHDVVGIEVLEVEDVELLEIT